MTVESLQAPTGGSVKREKDVHKACLPAGHETCCAVSKLSVFTSTETGFYT